MSIIKVNTYLTDRNITNMALNVDYNRLGEDRTQITVNYGTTPATVTIKNGSIIECNGNRYLIDADYSFQMANAAYNYLTFTDNPSIAFSSAATIGTFDAEKQGYYQADNLTRTLKYYIDQSGESEFCLIDAVFPNLTLTAHNFDKMKIGISTDYTGPATKIPFNTAYFDELGSFDLANYKYVARESGYYVVLCRAYYSSIGSAYIRLNGINIENVFAKYSGWIYNDLLYLIKGDEIDVYMTGTGKIYSGEYNTAITIYRIL